MFNAKKTAAIFHEKSTDSLLNLNTPNTAITHHSVWLSSFLRSPFRKPIKSMLLRSVFARNYLTILILLLFEPVLCPARSSFNNSCYSLVVLQYCKWSALARTRIPWSFPPYLFLLLISYLGMMRQQVYCSHIWSHLNSPPMM